MITSWFAPVTLASMLCPRGGPWDRVGTLIRNKNLESNFLILGIRFLFKVPHLGEAFELSISHQTKNFKPSEVKSMCLHMTRLSLIVLLQRKAAGRSALLLKNLHTTKALKTSFNLTLFSLIISLSWWIHKPQNITAHYKYSSINIYNYSSFSCRILKFKLRTFKFVLVLQVIVGPLLVVSCDTMLYLLFIQNQKQLISCCTSLTNSHKKTKEQHE